MGYVPIDGQTLYYQHPDTWPSLLDSIVDLDLASIAFPHT